MIRDVVEGSSLVTIIAKWIAFVVDFWYGGWTIPTPIHLEDLLVWMSQRLWRNCVASCIM